MQFADLLKDKKVASSMMRTRAWIADYPDAQNFLQLLYGPNTDQPTTSARSFPSTTGSTRSRSRCPMARSATSSTAR